MEEYVDETLANSKKRTHLDDFGLILDHMELFQFILNPKKCTFGVTSKKILGYIISSKGIGANPKKIQAIMEISPSKNISQLRSLQGSL